MNLYASTSKWLLELGALLGAFFGALLCVKFCIPSERKLECQEKFLQAKIRVFWRSGIKGKADIFLSYGNITVCNPQ